MQPAKTPADFGGDEEKWLDWWCEVLYADQSIPVELKQDWAPACRMRWATQHPDKPIPT